MRVLLTGGAGFIGSHVLVETLKSLNTVLVLDNFQNSWPISLTHIETFLGENIQLVEGDVRNKVFLSKVFQFFKPDAVIHLAGLKSVTDSLKAPVTYYNENITGVLNLLQVMREFDVKHLLFSSSASLYGEPQSIPINETHVCNPTSPYGRSKYFIEQIITDWVSSTPGASGVILRYFNPIGAHHSGCFGENPKNISKNLISILADIAVSGKDKLSVFGNDYDTPDGTCIRDYIHVEDLAKGHVSALNYLKSGPKLEIFNLGTGKGASVLELAAIFEKISGKKIPFEMKERRDGEISVSIANPAKANKILNWHSEKSLEKMCSDTWRWFNRNK